MNFDSIGEMALGSRLRTLSEKVTEDAQTIYELYDVPLKAKWFPIFYFLSKQESPQSITTIAKAIGHSHPSVIKISREMVRAGLIQEQKDAFDGRKTNILLTQEGINVSIKIKDQYLDVEKAIKQTLEQTKHNLWVAMQEFEYLLDEKTLFKRVLEQKKKRESSSIEIVDYQTKYQNDFKRLNEQWITKYFKIEEADSKALDNPEDYILKRGGHIIIAIQEQEVIGVCALLKMHNHEYDYELAKMAVSPKAHGKGIGYLLGTSILEKAKQLDAKTVYLESNTILKPAISLYDKLGFQKVSGHYTPYERSNIQMVVTLDK